MAPRAWPLLAVSFQALSALCVRLIVASDKLACGPPLAVIALAECMRQGVKARRLTVCTDSPMPSAEFASRPLVGALGVPIELPLLCPLRIWTLAVTGYALRRPPSHWSLLPTQSVRAPGSEAGPAIAWAVPRLAPLSLPLTPSVPRVMVGGHDMLKRMFGRKRTRSLVEA